MTRYLSGKMSVVLLMLAQLLATTGAVGGNQDAPKPPDRAAAQAVFERLKKLDGTWHGKSTAGWAEDYEIRTIAKGSVVTMQSLPEQKGSAAGNSEPTAPMLTVYHMDGDRLLLTHYCEAKNQPRLAVTSISEDGRTVTFTFLDATNLSSRDQGHMDKVVLMLADENHFSERWTWYQNGHEQWLEQVENQRIAKSGRNP